MSGGVDTSLDLPVSVEAYPLFQPEFLGCPVCNKAKGSHGGYRTRAHRRIGDKQFKGYGCDHQFSLYDALKYDVSGGVFGVLGTFAHWTFNLETSVESGKITSIPLDTPADVTPFTAFLTQQGSADRGFGIYPHIMSLNKDELVMSGAATTNANPQEVGIPVELNVSVYGFKSDGAKGWVRLLFDGLNDFASHQYSLSVFKLATSLEVYADELAADYLDLRGVAEPMKLRFVNAGRNWPERFSRMLDIMREFLLSDEVENFSKMRQPFQEDVRKFRNEFAHSSDPQTSHHQCQRAFEVAFELYWFMTRLAEELTATQLSREAR